METWGNEVCGRQKTLGDAALIQPADPVCGIFFPIFDRSRGIGNTIPRLILPCLPTTPLAAPCPE